MVPKQPGDTSNVEDTSYFTAGLAFNKMFKSVARFVNAATIKTRNKVGIDCILSRVETLAERVFPRILDVH